MSIGYTNITSDSYLIGDISPAIINTYGDKWLLCNGESVDETEYPELYSLIPFSYINYISDPLSSASATVWSEGSFVNGLYAVCSVQSNNIVIYVKENPDSATQSYTISGYTFITYVSELFYINGYYCVVGKTSTGFIICYATSLNGTWSFNQTTYGVSANTDYHDVIMLYVSSSYEISIIYYETDTDRGYVYTYSSSSLGGTFSYLTGLMIDDYITRFTCDGYLIDNDIVVFYGKDYWDSTYYTWRLYRTITPGSVTGWNTNHATSFMSYVYGGWICNGKIFGYTGTTSINYADSTDILTVSTYTNTELSSSNYPVSICFYDNNYIILTANYVYVVDSTFTTTTRYDKTYSYVGRNTRASYELYEIGNIYNYYYTSRCVPLITYDGAYAYIKAE